MWQKICIQWSILYIPSSNPRYKMFEAIKSVGKLLVDFRSFLSFSEKWQKKKNAKFFFFTSRLNPLRCFLKWPLLLTSSSDTAAFFCSSWIIVDDYHFLLILITFPVDTGRKLNVHKTFRRRPGRLLNVLCTFNLRPVSKGLLIIINYNF